MPDQKVKAVGGEYRALSPEEIAKGVRRLRENLGLKQLVLAERAGVNERTIQRVERGERVQEQTLKQIASALFLDEEIFIARQYIPSEQRLIEHTLNLFKDHYVVKVMRLELPKHMQRILGSQAWLVDDNDVAHKDRHLVASLQESISDWGDIYGELSATQKLQASEDLLGQIRKFEHLAYTSKYGTCEVMFGRVPCTLGIVKVWPRDDPRSRLSQMMLPKREIRLH